MQSLRVKRRRCPGCTLFTCVCESNVDFLHHRFTKSDHEALVEIFKKIGQKELTKVGILSPGYSNSKCGLQVGLQELFSFKQKNPHVDLEPFLAQSSQYFRWFSISIFCSKLLQCN